MAGIEALAYRPAALERRTSACLRRLGVDSIASAIAMIQRRPALSREIPGTFLLGVSNFFRDPPVWHALENEVLPGLVKSSRHLRVLSAGCSEGQELYSMAILLAEAGVLEQSSLCGLDCRQEAIVKAQAGTYKESILQEVPPRLHKYFEVRFRAARVIAPVRFALAWQVSNLLSFDEDAQWDIILFRNLAIYLNDEACGKIWAALARALKPGAILVTGRAERPPEGLGLRRLSPSIYRKGRDSE